MPAMAHEPLFLLLVMFTSLTQFVMVVLPKTVSINPDK